MPNANLRQRKAATGSSAIEREQKNSIDVDLSVFEAKNPHNLL